MITERKWLAIGPQLLTADGTTEGEIQVTLACLFKVGMTIQLSSNTVPADNLQIKRIVGTSIFLGEKGQGINDRKDLTAFLVGDSAQILSLEQDRSRIAPDDVWRAVYHEEPAMALRSILIDECGDPIGSSPDNPLHTQLSDGSVNIGTVNAELEVQLSHRDDFPDLGDVADSVQIGDGEDILRINPDGSISTADSGLDRQLDIENNIIYEGFAEPGTATSAAGWRISRTVKQAGGDLVTTLAGTGTFDQIWDNRTSLFPAVAETDFFDRRFERLLPILANANFLKLGDFDRVAPTFNADDVEMDYFQNGANIAKATVRYVSDLDWEINLERYINDSNGDILLDDDDTPLFLD